MAEAYRERAAKLVTENRRKEAAMALRQARSADLYQEHGVPVPQQREATPNA
jgi:hypothetical protein